MGVQKSGRELTAEGQLETTSTREFTNFHHRSGIGPACHHLSLLILFAPSPLYPAQVFEEVSALVVSVLDGFNVSIMAYGESPPSDPLTLHTLRLCTPPPLPSACPSSTLMHTPGQTGSGKTHTMEGPDTDPGVNSRALSELFRWVQWGRADGG